MRFREAILEAAEQLVRVVSQQDGGDALGARGDKDGAEGGLSNSELDLLARAPGTVSRRSHAEHAGRARIEAPAGIEAGLVDRLGYRGAGGQSLADLLGTVGRRILLRRQSRDGLEHAMEVARAAPDRIRELLQRGLFLPILD